MTRLVIPVPLRPPPDAQCNWWIIGVFDENGMLVEASNAIVPETRLGDVVITARWAMEALMCRHAVITSGEPDHEVLYEEKNGEVLVNRLGA